MYPAIEREVRSNEGNPDNLLPSAVVALQLKVISSTQKLLVHEPVSLSLSSHEKR